MELFSWERDMDFIKSSGTYTAKPFFQNSPSPNTKETKEENTVSYWPVQTISRKHRVSSPKTLVVLLPTREAETRAMFAEIVLRFRDKHPKVLGSLGECTYTR
ncbi:hypothetical protein SO802_016564, partial [Lithocarpus litseifolius]